MTDLARKRPIWAASADVSATVKKHALRCFAGMTFLVLAFSNVLNAQSIKHERQSELRTVVANDSRAVPLNADIEVRQLKGDDDRGKITPQHHVAQASDVPRIHPDSDKRAQWLAEPFGAFDMAREALDLRDQFTKHFENADGTITAVTSNGPMHYYEDGEWRTLFTQIEPSGEGFVNTTNFFKTEYPGVASEPIKTLLPNGSALESMHSSQVYTSGGTPDPTQRPANPVTGICSGNAIIYGNAYGDGIDLRVTQGSSMHKVDLILQHQAAIDAQPGDEHFVFEEQLVLPLGVTAKLIEGEIVFVKTSGKPIAKYALPLVYEQNPIVVNDEVDQSPLTLATYDLDQQGNLLTIQTKVTLDWLMAENRSFPVVIDPTLEVYPDNDAFWTQFGGANDTGGNGAVVVGRANLGNGFTNWRGSMKFNVSSIPAGSSIDNIEVNYYVDFSLGWESNTGRFVRFRQVTTDPILWPTYLDVFNNANSGTQYVQTPAGTHSIGGEWRSIDLGAAANGYLQNTSMNAGWFALGVSYGGGGFTGNNNRVLIIDGHASANRPYLAVTYTSACSDPTPAGTLSVNLSQTVSNDVLTYTLVGGQGLIGYDASFDNFNTFDFYVTNAPELALQVLSMNDATLQVRAVHEEGGCPTGYSNVATTIIDCASWLSFGTSDGDYITNVSFGSIDNSSSSDYDSGPDPTLILDAYQDFTNLSTDVCKGGSYDLAVSGTSTFGADQGFAAWIDWNGDGLFDSSENVLLDGPAPSVSASVTVPLNAVDGPVKMRVMSAWNESINPDPCFVTDYGWGEIEEYVINITGCTYYSVESGSAHAAIWNTNPSATVGETAVISPASSFVVRNGETVTLLQNFVCNDLTIESTDGAGTLTVDSDEVITLYGNFTHIGGTFNAGEGTLLFNAGVAQSIQTTAALYHVTVNNASGVSITNDLDLRGILQIDQGDFTASPYRVRLISDAVRTAGIGAIANGSSYVGEVIHERYLPPGLQFWLNLCNPILGKTLNDWNATLITTGFPGSDFPNYNFVNIKQYDETVEGGMNDGFTDPAGINDPLDDTFGYLVYLTGAAQFTTVTGEIQQGSKNVPLEYTPTGDPQADGWELMANIYPCEVSWEEIYNASTGLSPTYYVYDAENGAYINYTASLGLGMASGYIPSGQSFWVRTNQNGASLQWEETHKSDVGTQFEREVNPEISFVSVGIASQSQQQAAYLVFEDGMSHGFDSGSDAVHLGSMSTSAPEICWKSSGGEKLVLSRIPKVYQNVEVFLHLNIKQAGTYTLTVDETQHLPEFTCMYFEDLENGDVYSLEAGEVITLTFEEPFNDNRFVLHVNAPIEASSVAPTCFNTEDAIIQVSVNGASEYQLTLTDDSGDTVSVQQGNESALFGGLSAGSYTITADSDSEVCHAMIVQVEVIAPDEPIVDVLTTVPYCNVAGMGELEVLASGAGDFTINLFDHLNNPMHTQTIEAGALDLTDLNPGVYQVIVSNQCVTESFEVNLEDENSVVAYAAFNNELVIENNHALITADALCANADGWYWFVNGQEVANGGNLNYAITTEGSYFVELFAYNEHCSDSFTFEISTTTVTYIQNNEHDHFKLAMTGQGITLFVPSLDKSLMIDLFDAGGRLILQDVLQPGSGRQVDIPTGALSMGNYILKIANEEVNRTWNIQAHR